jgi:hypothetical protein
MKPATLLDTKVVSWTTDFLINNSVLYYLSCCLLLLGDYSMMHSPWLSVGFLANYCEIYGIFLSYVILLTALCLLVFRRLAMAEDGLVMAGMVLLLILDPTFFNSVFYTFKLGAGLAVNSFCFALGMTLFAVLTIGGIPWPKTSRVAIVLAAAFVYYYPVGLNAPWAAATKQSYFYWLSWMPLVVVILSQRTNRESSVSSNPLGPQLQKTAEGVARSVSPVIPRRLQQRFQVASVLIVFYIVLSHLSEAGYAYTLELHPEQLTATLLAVGLLCFKLKANLGRNGRQFLWACAILAACCSCAPTEYSMVRLPWGIVLSSFQFGFTGVALFLLYFWKTYLNPSWATAAAVCLAFTVSGSSLEDSVFNIFHFHFGPYAFLAAVLAVCSLFRRSWLFPALSGACVLISILSLVPFESQDKFAIFLQGSAVWLGLVLWRFYQCLYQWVYSLVGLFVLSVSAVMYTTSSHPVAWGVDYFLAAAGVFLAGRFLQNRFLATSAVLGILGAALYLLRTPIASLAAAFRRIINFGLLVTILAFLLLPLAYFLSVLRARRREQSETGKQLVPDES